MTLEQRSPPQLETAAKAPFSSSGESEERPWEFPGGPVAKTSPSNAGVSGSIPIKELSSHIPPG